MAKLVYGFGSSHGPLLSTPADKWDLRADADRANPELAFRDGTYTYDELLETRHSNYLSGQNEISVREERAARNQKQLDALGEKLREVAPDIIVLIGDDQHEWFGDQNQPAFSVFCGDKVINKAISPERLKTMQAGIAYTAKANKPPQDQDYPVAQSLAEAIIGQAMDDEIDVSASMTPPTGPRGSSGVGHAVGFIYRRILKDKPIPVVPILLNTFYPPNQAKPGRCYDFGKSIGRAIRNWDGDTRVALCASGGLSHFVVDEEWDQKMLTALKNQDRQTIADEPNIMFRSGTSETKNWIATAGAVAETGLEMTVHDYVPCYRTDAGTGSGMGFATWT